MRKKADEEGAKGLSFRYHRSSYFLEFPSLFFLLPRLYNRRSRLHVEARRGRCMSISRKNDTLDTACAQLVCVRADNVADNRVRSAVSVAARAPVQRWWGVAYFTGAREASAQWGDRCGGASIGQKRRETGSEKKMGKWCPTKKTKGAKTEKTERNVSSI